MEDKKSVKEILSVWWLPVFIVSAVIALIIVLVGQRQEEAKAKEASRYEVSGVVEGFHTVVDISPNHAMKYNYYVSINGKEYPVDEQSKPQLIKGNYVTLEGDKDGVISLGTNE